MAKQTNTPIAPSGALSKVIAEINQIVAETKQVHTPGPWLIDEVSLYGKRHMRIKRRSGSGIAIILSDRDARLIQHAPALYAAAKAALVYVVDQSEDGTDGFVDVCEVHRKLRIAIAKVEGEQA